MWMSKDQCVELVLSCLWALGISSGHKARQQVPCVTAYQLCWWSLVPSKRWQDTHWLLSFSCHDTRLLWSFYLGFVLRMSLDVLSNHILVAVRWYSRPHGTEVAFGVPGTWVWSIVLPLLFPIYSPRAEVMDIHFHTSFPMGVEIKIQVLMPVASWCLSCCCGRYSEQRNLRQKGFMLTPSSEHSVSCWGNQGSRNSEHLEMTSAVKGWKV